MQFIKRSAPAAAGLGEGILFSLLALAVGTVIYTGEPYGTEPTPPEQVYFF